MKHYSVHFIGALEGDQRRYETIIDTVEQLGYRIVTRHSVTRKIKDLSQETPREAQSYSRRMIAWVKTSDIVLVEATVSNFGAGFEIATALKLGKPVIVLYRNLGTNIPYVLMGDEDKRLLLSEYTDLSMRSDLEHLLSQAEAFTSERFTLILPTSIIKHLDRIAETGMNRSEYIRTLIAKESSR